MIVQAIEKYERYKPVKESKEKWIGKIGTDKHKQSIFLRSLQRCKFNIGEWVLDEGQLGQITDIYTPQEYEYVTWIALKCHFIEVFFTDNEMGVYNPSDLKRHK